jgi:hypothetical protein
LNHRRNFTSFAAIYQFQEQRGITPIAFRSDILSGFFAIPVFRVDLSSSLHPKKHREQETKDERETGRWGRFFSSFPEPSGGPLRINA